MTGLAREPLAILILAAGRSRRMGKDNKLCHLLKDKPLLQHSLEACHQAAIAPCFVVTGYDAAPITALANRFEMPCLYHQAHDKGMGTSIAYGISQLAGRFDQIMIMLGDMPFVTPDHITALYQAHCTLANPQERISRPLYDGKAGHPVIWGRHFFDALAKLDGDIGGQSLITQTTCHLVPLSYDRKAPLPATVFDQPDDFLMH